MELSGKHLMIDGFPTELTARLTGVSRSLLETWLRTKFLLPSVPAERRGVSATYSFQDLVAIRVVAQLRDAGISPQALRRVVEYLRSRKGLSTTTEALVGTTLITDGQDVFEVVDEVTFSALKRPGQRVLFVVPLGELVTELQAKARAQHAA
jgi:DNA-binding transcriptional MerR regulator